MNTGAFQNGTAASSTPEKTKPLAELLRRYQSTKKIKTSRTIPTAKARCRWFTKSTCFQNPQVSARCEYPDGRKLVKCRTKPWKRKSAAPILPTTRELKSNSPSTITSASRLVRPSTLRTSTLKPGLAQEIPDCPTESKMETDSEVAGWRNVQTRSERCEQERNFEQ